MIRRVKCLQLVDACRFELGRVVVYAKEKHVPNYGLVMLLCKQAINVKSAVFGIVIRFLSQIVICTGTCFFDVFRVKGQNTKSAMKKKSVLLNQLALGSGGQKLFDRYKIQ